MLYNGGMQRWSLLLVSCLAVGALSIGGCGGLVEEDPDDDLPDDVATMADGLATGVDPDDGDDDDDDRAHGDRREGRRDGRKHGDRRHKHRQMFRRLDRLDGVKDGRITLASLPPNLPERLVARLARLDVDGSGDVSREEARVACHEHRR